MSKKSWFPSYILRCFENSLYFPFQALRQLAFHAQLKYFTYIKQIYDGLQR